MRARLPALALVVLAVGATAGGSSAQPDGSGFKVRTIATLRGNVLSFAQSDRYLAWVKVSPDLGCATLFVRRAQGEARMSTRRNCVARGGDLGALVLAGDRAYWEERGASNLTQYSTLMTASLRHRKIGNLKFQSISNAGFDHIVPPASDGRSVYFWTSPEDATPGPIVRFTGGRSRRMTRTISRVHALGAGEGRWAFARAVRTFDCAQAPAWSPDGGLMVYASAGGSRCRGGIWVRNVGGPGERRIADAGTNPDWSPDGSKLAYDRAGAVVISDATGSNARPVISPGSDPAWSPDGTKLAFTRDRAILVAAADGSGERVVLTGAVKPDWAPDGTQLVFARTDPRNPGLGVVGVDGSGPRSLTTDHDTEPALSPDRQLIAYSHCWNAHAGCPRDARQIFVAAPDGSGKRARTEDSDETEDTAPTWAPDSGRLAFARSRDWQDEGDSHVFTPAGQLTKTPLPQTPVVVLSRSGRTLGRLTPSGEAVELAVTRRLTAAIVRAGTWRLDIFAPKRRTLTFLEVPALSSLSVSGDRIVVLAGRRMIHLYNVRTGRLDVVARAASAPIGLSIVGRRIAWAENVGRGARIRAVVFPR